ncbi:hypothetical protein ZWY2020_023548 [Hordeum vulgare]|nr:hypothetical protein ZWY2020_023548 [Hordeum vulgare]
MAASSSSRGGDGDDDNEPYLVGFVVAKIVGLKYYTGTSAGREPPSRAPQPLRKNAIAAHNSAAIDGSVLIDRTTSKFSCPVRFAEHAKKSADVNKLFACGEGRGAGLSPWSLQRMSWSHLFEHRKAALGWLHVEESCDLPPFWKEDQAGGYENVLTSQNTKQRPQPLRGGIFVDDMGLGKTLTLLSLIARSKARNVGGGKAKGSKRRKIDDAEAGSRMTLVVCPPSVCSSWVTQLEEHTNADSLKEVSPVNDIEWFRVILDEAHIIKNSAALQTSRFGPQRRLLLVLIGLVPKCYASLHWV